MGIGTLGCSSFSSTSVSWPFHLILSRRLWFTCDKNFTKQRKAFIWCINFDVCLQSKTVSAILIYYSDYTKRFVVYKCLIFKCSYLFSEEFIALKLNKINLARHCQYCEAFNFFSIFNTRVAISITKTAIRYGGLKLPPKSIKSPALPITPIKTFN